MSIRVNRKTLDLAFKNEAEPPPAQQTFSDVPLVPPVTTIPQRRSGFQASFQEPCPKAGPGAVPEEGITFTITKPPGLGWHTYRNEGKIVNEGQFAGTFPYLPFTVREIRNFQRVDPNNFRFRVFEDFLIDTWRLRTFQVSPTALVLVSETTRGRTLDGSTAEFTFQPTPAVTFMTLGAGENSTWRSAGVDPNNGSTLVIEGRIDKRETLDVCGKIYDSYRVISNQRFSNVVASLERTTDANDPNIYNVATQLGGVILREDINETSVFTNRATGQRFSSKVDFVGTVMSASPRQGR